MRLRRALAGGADGSIVTRGNGYELVAGESNVDVEVFHRLARPAVVR